MAWFRKSADRASEKGLVGSSGFGAHYQRVWERKELPQAGAQQWAWETLALPLYSVIGWGQPVRSPLRAVDPSQFQKKGITLTTIGNPGILAGQMVSQPLLSESDATAFGLLTPGNSNPFNVV